MIINGMGAFGDGAPQSETPLQPAPDTDVKSAAVWLFVALGIVLVGGAFLPRR